MKALQTREYISLYMSHCTEMLQRHCYNNGNDRFSCSDCNAFVDFIVCVRSRDYTHRNHCNYCKKNDRCRYCNNVIEAFQRSVTYTIK